jgi:hypothetical protein
MWRLILKDIEQHAKTILIFFLSALILPSAFSLLAADTQDGAGYHGVVFGYLALGAPALFAFWFIGQEKMKGTFKLLRILPIAGRKLILAKAIASALLCLSVVNLVAALVPLMIYTLTDYRWFLSWKLIFWLNLITLFLASVDIAVFTLLETKIASQAIYLGHTFAAFAVFIAVKNLPPVINLDLLWRRLNAPGFLCWEGMLVILLSYLIIDFSGRMFESREWVELEEN